MPIYEYRCGRCGHELEVMQKISDPAPDPCPKCGEAGALERLMSRTSFQLKGGGWYADLYGSAKKDAGSSNASAAPAPATTTSSAAAPASGSAGSSGSGSSGAGSSGSGSSGSGSSGSGSSGSGSPPKKGGTQ